jgi:peptide/nickel transport system substrate-binding protein
MSIHRVLPKVVIATALASLVAASVAVAATRSTSATRTLVVARTGDVDLLDPAVVTAFQSKQALELIYDGLVEFDKNLKVVPSLATKWTYSNGGKTLTFTLRKGVKFHDGSAFDSTDAKATLDRIKDPKTAATTSSNLASIVAVDAPSPTVLRLTLSTPDASLPAAMADVSNSVLSSADIAAATVKTKPNGTGAFSFASWDQGSALHLAANAKYWGGAPKVKGVDIRVVPDESSILAGLRAKQFDVGILSDPTVVKQVPKSLKLYQTPSLDYYEFAMNSTRGPFTKQKVRQAISCAIDRKQVVQSAAAGEGAVTGPFTSPTYKTAPFKGLPCTPPDLPMAKKLLAQAGYPSGFSVNTMVLTGEHAVMPNIAQNVQAQLQQIGVSIKTEALDTNTFVSRWRVADFDSYITINGGTPDPHHMYFRYFSSGGSLNQVGKYHSDRLDGLFAKGLAETNVDKRGVVYDQISKTLLNVSPWAWLYKGYHDRVVQPTVKGYIAMPNGSLRSLRDVSVG